MPKIGIVLAGGASKGAYEIGCLRAIEDWFGLDSIKCISSASVGSIITQCYGRTRAEGLEEAWRGIDTEHFGRFFLNYATNSEIMGTIYDLAIDGPELPYEHYVSIWNFSKGKLEYVPYHKLSGNCLQKYLRGGCAVPFITKGETINGNRIYDGAFLDNIPAMPLMDKDLDYIFCIYFDNYRYMFENKEFDRKMIKLFDFPNKHRLELLFFTKSNFDGMIQYGYDYTTATIRSLFSSNEPESIYKAIEHRERNMVVTYQPRFSADVVLNNMNVMAKRQANREARRKKKKPQ